MPKLINSYHRTYKKKGVPRTPHPVLGLLTRRGVPRNIHQTPKVRNHWRDSTDYRKEYFRKNKGVCGLYFCSQCMRAMFRRNPRLEVDHIYPPSRMSRRNRRGTTNTSIMARGLNSTWNCVPICSDCNRAKSDKIGLVTVRGVAAKLISTSRQAAFWVVARLFGVVWNLTAVTALRWAGRMTSRLLGRQRRSVFRRKRFKGGRRFVR